jgi:imidazole glycerol phosphate synthase subunit HisF
VGAWANLKIRLMQCKRGNADAVAMADILYYDRATINDIRSVAISADIEVRGIEYA